MSIVVVDDNPGGMFPLMLAIVWLTLDVAAAGGSPGRSLAGARRRCIVELHDREGLDDESGIVYFAGGSGISWLVGRACCGARRR